jgi:hypothetical protein
MAIQPPIAASAAEPTFSRIEPSACRTFATAILAICTAGLYLVGRACQLHYALKSGDTETAKVAIDNGGWLIYQYAIGSDDFRNLAIAEKVDLIKLIAAQILFNTETPSEGSSASIAFLEARDTHVDGYERLKVLKEIRPDIPRTVSDAHAAVFGNSRRIFATDVPKPEPDPFFTQYLEHIYRDCKDIVGCTANTFIKAMHERFPEWTYDQNQMISTKLILTEYYNNYDRLSTDPYKEKKINNLFSFSLEELLKEPSFTPDTFADAVDNHFPSRERDPHPPINRDFLIRYFKQSYTPSLTNIEEGEE